MQPSELMAASSHTLQLPSTPLEPYAIQQARLPTAGRHFVANYCDTSDTVVVYQAYMPEIAQAAAEHQRFTASTSYQTERMTWIKPGFMWMMYRSGWASKPNQEHILAVHLRRSWLFDTLRSKSILSVHSIAGKTKNHAVIVQWDPDHDHLGRKLQRRAVQIGLRGATAAEYAAGVEGPAVLKIEDITTYVEHMRSTIVSKLQEADDKVREGQQKELGETTTDTAVISNGYAASEQEAMQVALMQLFVVPVEDVVQLDDGLQAVLDMQTASGK